MDSENPLPRCRDNLDGKVNHQPSKRDWVTRHGENIKGNIALVRLIEKMTHQQKIVIGPIHTYPFKGKLLPGSKLLLGAMDQLAPATSVIKISNRLGLQRVFPAIFPCFLMGLCTILPPPLGVRVVKFIFFYNYNNNKSLKTKEVFYSVNNRSA